MEKPAFRCFLKTGRGASRKRTKVEGAKTYESVGIMWTSDDARLPGQFVIMTGTADRVFTARNDSSSAGVKPFFISQKPRVRIPKIE